MNSPGSETPVRPVSDRQLAELRETAAAALCDWFEAGVRAGREPMLMAAELTQLMGERLG